MKKLEKELRILIAASGTGGHLFPAVDIAKAFQKNMEGTKVEFVGSGRYLEAEIIDKAGFKRHVVNIVGLKQRGMKGLLQFMLMLPKAVFQTWNLMNSFKPNLVVGVGGYVSVLPVVMAKLLGIPTLIHEAERTSGMANRFLAYFASRISLAFQDAVIPCKQKTVYTGQPVREVFKEIAGEAKDVSVPKNLLITGGSQGARALDNVAISLAKFFKEHGLSIRHQCRSEDKEQVVKAYHVEGVDAETFEFIADLPSCYRWCDIVLARSGAGCTMEIGAINRPAIFVPFPYAQGNHQLKNAQILAKAGKALIVEEGENFTERLQEAFKQLLEPSEYKKMKNLEYKSRSLNAADEIAKEGIKLCKIN